MFESSKPMIIVMRAVIRFPAARGGVELFGKRGCPFLPCKIPLFGELHRERERLGLPRLGKHRLALILRQSRQGLETLGFRYGIRRTQCNPPTCRDRRRRAMRLAPPTIPAQR